MNTLAVINLLSINKYKCGSVNLYKAGRRQAHANINTDLNCASSCKFIQFIFILHLFNKTFTNLSTVVTKITTGKTTQQFFLIYN